MGVRCADYQVQACSTPHHNSILHLCSNLDGLRVRVRVEVRRVCGAWTTGASMQCPTPQFHPALMFRTGRGLGWRKVFVWRRSMAWAAACVWRTRGLRSPATLAARSSNAKPLLLSNHAVTVALTVSNPPLSQGIQFVKHLGKLDVRAKQLAEVSVYFK